jgi:predicted NBD/HSP70 family sugar kinase
MLAAEPVTTSDLAAINARRLVDTILVSGAISRAQLARDTGLSKPTVSLALARLVEVGLLREVGRTSGGRGATAQLYDLYAAAGYGLAVDLGRRWVRAAVTDLTGRRVGQLVRPTGATSAAALGQQLEQVALAVLGQAGVPPRSVVSAVLGTPGVALPDGDRVRLAPSLPGLQQPGVLQRLRDVAGVPVAVENDVNLAAMAELAFGLGQQERDFAFLSVGTGVGLALVLDGRLRRGATGSAGEIGFLPVPEPADAAGLPKGRVRRRGAFESAVGADAFVRTARSAGLTLRTAPQVVQAARAGDAAAVDAVDRLADDLALGVLSVAAILDPGLVVLGGGLGVGAADLLVGSLDRALARLSPLRPRVMVSRLGDHAVLDGAAAAAAVAAQQAVFGTATGHRRDARALDLAGLAAAAAARAQSDLVEVL